MTARSDRVQKLIDDPDLKQAFADVRQALLQAFSKTPISKTEELIDCRKRLHLLDSVEANLYQAIEDGHLEDFRAQEQERPPFLGDLLKWPKKA